MMIPKTAEPVKGVVMIVRLGMRELKLFVWIFQAKYLTWEEHFCNEQYCRSDSISVLQLILALGNYIDNTEEM